MNGTFNGLILVEKLARLNNSQQSIETLSHWCIFHMNKAKQVVETWDRQFHCSPREQRLSFLYLANDILQNSRRKGSEFVAEFWKVLPDALSDVIENGDESGRNAAMRLIDIWEERKVFGSRGKLLKKELVGRNLENANKNGKNSGLKLKQSLGNMLEKIISGYEIVYDGPVEEGKLMSKCREALGSVDKVEKEIGSDYSAVQLDGPEFVELQEQHGILRECIVQLRSAESSRETLLSNLKECLQEQEFKLDEIRSQLQVAEMQSERTGNICQQILSFKSGQSSKEASTFNGMPPGFTPEIQTGSRDKEQSAPVMYTPRVPSNNPYIEDDPRKSAAAAVAAKLTASTSSAQMLTFVLSSLASEGVISHQFGESSSEYPLDKRPKLESGGPSYGPSSPQHPPPPLPPFPHPDSVQQPMGTSSSQPLMPHQPPPPTSPPMQPPPPPLPVGVTQTAPIMQTSGTITSGSYTYSAPPQRPPLFPNYPMGGMGMGMPFPSMPRFPSPPNPYNNFQTPEGGFYGHGQPPMPASPSMSRQ